MGGKAGTLRQQTDRHGRIDMVRYRNHTHMVRYPNQRLLRYLRRIGLVRYRNQMSAASVPTTHGCDSTWLVMVGQAAEGGGAPPAGILRQHLHTRMFAPTDARAHAWS